MSSLPRPPETMLRGFGMRSLRTGIVQALALATVGSGAFYAFYVIPKKRKYDEWFRTYDPYKHLEEMCKKNLLQACPENLAKVAREKGRKVPGD